MWKYLCKNKQNKKFTIVEDVYYTSNGCDCCEPTEFYIYEVYDENNNVIDTNCSLHSVEDAYSAILEHLNISVDVEFFDEGNK